MLMEVMCLRLRRIAKMAGVEDKRLSEIPIIAMTANAFAEDRKQAFDAGMNGHIAKPINAEDLKTTLAGIL